MILFEYAPNTSDEFLDWLESRVQDVTTQDLTSHLAPVKATKKIAIKNFIEDVKKEIERTRNGSDISG